MAGTLDGALRLARAAKAAGITHGVVQDKLFLPGMIKLQRLIGSGFFGRVLSVRLEFGYWVFEGDEMPAQRPSWNYRAEDGGGIVLDMFPHWQYLLTDLFGPVSAVYARHATHMPRRWDESGEPYDATADDAAYAVLEFASGAFASVNSSWAVRVNRRELVELQVDGTAGSAVAGLRDCAVQHRAPTPRPVWNPDLPDPTDYRAQWTDVPDNQDFDNGFKVQWELFLLRVRGRPFPGTWPRGPGACSSPSWRCGPRPRAGGSRSRRWRSDVRVVLPATPPPQPPHEPEGLRGRARGRGCWPPAGSPVIDWEATLRFRDHLWAHGFGVAEAMDTAQRGMGLSWEQARELIGRSAARAAARAGWTARLRGRHRPAADGAASAARDHRRLRRAAGVRPGRRGAGHPDGQPGLAASARGPRTTWRSTASCSSRPTGR